MNSKKETLILAISLVICGFTGILAIWFIKKSVFSSYPTAPQNHQIVTDSKTLQTASLTIGILSNSESYEELVKYLKDTLGDKVQIVLNGGENISYQKAKDNIALKQWDIVFSLSPMISVAAEDNGYVWVGRMFPNKPPYYQSALFVRVDSPIHSIKDLTPSTMIALGDFNSASSFYMPSYDLYGKILIVDMGNRGKTIKEKVRTGKADVGSVAYDDTISKDADFRIIHLSRNIPGSGVYLSPNLSENDRTFIKKALLNAPDSMRQRANYGQGEAINYKDFIEIAHRVEKILACRNFKENPVSFFCEENSSLSPSNQLNSEYITGRINGITKVDEETTMLNIVTKNKKIYHVFINPKILNQIPDAGNIFNLQDKMVKISKKNSQKLSGKIIEITINLPEQMEVLP